MHLRGILGCVQINNYITNNIQCESTIVSLSFCAFHSKARKEWS